MNAIAIATVWQEAMFLILTLVLVMILPSLLVGLVVSTFQAATQINEQTLSFLPRLLTTLFVIVLAGPFIAGSVVDFTRELIASIPYMVF